MEPITQGTDAPAREEESPTPPKRMSVRRRAILMVELLFLIILMAVILAIGSGKIQIEQVISASMEPTLMTGDVILADANATPGLYEIVCLNNPQDHDEKLVKRIMGVPGDEIKIQDRTIYINNCMEVSKQILENSIEWMNMKTRVPQDAVFVLGDNRNNSYDSLNFGPVPYEQIRGVVRAIIWPPKHWGRPRALH